MKDRGRNTRAHYAPPTLPTTECVRCSVTLLHECSDGPADRCDGHLCKACYATLQLPEDEPHDCDFCGEEEPCLCRPEEEDGEETAHDCLGCGYCDECVEFTRSCVAEMEGDDEREQAEAHAARAFAIDRDAMEREDARAEAESEGCTCYASDFSGKSVCGHPCPVHAPRKVTS